MAPGATRSSVVVTMHATGPDSSARTPPHGDAVLDRRTSSR